MDSPRSNEPTQLSPGPLPGRTYALHAGEAQSDRYYQAIDAVADACLQRWPDARGLIAELRRASRRRLRKVKDVDSPVGFALTECRRALAPFLLDVERHRAALWPWSRLGATLGTTREQYLVHALEIELTNRLHRDEFLRRGTRVAFLPYCLRDLTAGCKAVKVDLDLACVSCSPRCYLNAVSRILRRNRVRPYIWMGASLGKTLRAQWPGGLGVLGIACIPELVAGMRHVDAAGLPVLGLPLDANRCARWLGEFQPNSVNLARLEALVGSRI
jgi:hypothetical protein